VTRVLDDAIHVWHLDPDAAIGEAQLAACRALLDEEELRRCARLRGEVRQRGFAVSHALVRSALSRCTQVAPQQWRFARGEHGRPEIAEPRGHRLRFNLSHTAGLAACGVAREVDLGIDVEAGARLREPQKLASRFFAPAEAAALRALPPAAQRGRFLDLWTLKEAYLKARGEGLGKRLREAAFDFDAAGVPTARLGPALADRAEAWQFELRRMPCGPRLALAIRRGSGPDRPIVFREEGALLEG